MKSFFDKLDEAADALKCETSRIAGGELCIESITCGELEHILHCIEVAIGKLKCIKMAAPPCPPCSEQPFVVVKVYINGDECRI